MFSGSLRRAFLKAPKFTPSKALSTTALPSNDAPPIIKQEQGIMDSGMGWLHKDEPELNATAGFNIRPVFLELSSLLPEEPGASASSSRIAALAPSVFRHAIRRDILHLCVVHHLDGLRQGTAATKTRGEVRGSGRKIRPQKGSGRARLGDAQSPMLRGGGHAFAKKARDFSTKLPRKVIQMGMRVALSAKVKENGLGVAETLEWPGVKTKYFAKRIQDLGWNKTLFVTGLEKVPEKLDRSSRNIQEIDTMTASELTVYDAVKWERLVLDVPAVEFFEKTLGKPEVDSLTTFE